MSPRASLFTMISDFKERLLLKFPWLKRFFFRSFKVPVLKESALLPLSIERWAHDDMPMIPLRRETSNLSQTSSIEGLDLTYKSSFTDSWSLSKDDTPTPLQDQYFGTPEAYQDFFEKVWGTNIDIIQHNFVQKEKGVLLKCSPMTCSWELNSVQEEEEKEEEEKEEYDEQKCYDEEEESEDDDEEEEDEEEKEVETQRFHIVSTFSKKLVNAQKYAKKLKTIAEKRLVETFPISFKGKPNTNISMCRDSSGNIFI